MARSAATLAGRPIPALAAVAVKLALLAFPLAIAWQVTQLQASAPTAPESAASLPAPTAAPAPAAPNPGRAGPANVVRWLTLDRPLTHGAYVWDEAGVPAGRIQVFVDLGAQTLSVFRAGREIGRAAILYGTEENPTPLGTFPIIEKDIDHVSNLYDAIMPYMLRLTNDGIAIHGSNVRYGWASRGCVGVPDEFAALLFAQARLGDVVMIVDSTRTS